MLGVAYVPSGHILYYDGTAIGSYREEISPQENSDFREIRKASPKLPLPR